MGLRAPFRKVLAPGLLIGCVAAPGAAPAQPADFPIYLHCTAGDRTFDFAIDYGTRPDFANHIVIEDRSRLVLKAFSPGLGAYFPDILCDPQRALGLLAIGVQHRCEVTREHVVVWAKWESGEANGIAYSPEITIDRASGKFTFGGEAGTCAEERAAASAKAAP